MNKGIIPISFSQMVSLTDGEKKELSNKRSALISELRCITGFPEVVSNLNQDTVYDLVLKPEGAKLYKDAKGNLGGVFYKDGKIVEHAKFQEIGPSMLKAVKAAGTQVLMVSIAMQLNRIEEQVSKIFRELHGDRLAEIEAGRSLFWQACGMQNSENREQLALNAITVLTCGFEKTVSALARQIADLPEENLSFFDNWIGDKSKEAQEKHRTAAESFSACLNALQIMARCHLFLEERNVALKLVDEGFSKIEKAGVEVAYMRSRLAPKVNGSFPEKSWKQFIEYRKSFDSNQIANLIHPKEDIVAIEIKPSEIMGEGYAKV
ncbi:hypothetical protein [Nitrosomonas sp. sh817]|uniref:hypothetical protein n=1 Tax=Nitrosomonas sp. sh817 TaxID=3070658 RepID=UPI0027DC660F|nr:hypothetical protein [Nitrosomonas sp. sh817]WMJ07526.1 hypothetical protein RBH92_08745 [Nitrosomonas sp. sh817]